MTSVLRERKILGYLENGIAIVESLYVYCPFLRIDITDGDCFDISEVKGFLYEPEFDHVRERINSFTGKEHLEFCMKCQQRGW